MDDSRVVQLKKLRNELEGIRVAKHKTFAELNSLAEKIFKQFPDLFPAYEVNKKGSKFVHHPGVLECQPISLEKEHGNREFLPHRYAKFALEGLEMLLDHIESKINENT